MTVSTLERPLAISPDFDFYGPNSQHGFRRTYGKYALWAAFPGSPLYAKVLHRARLTQKEAYIEEGLAKERAVKGRYLPSSIDKSSHLTEGVQIFLAENTESPKDRATARLIEATAPEELATFSLAGAGIDPSYLEVMRDQANMGHLKELGVLAKSALAHKEKASDGSQLVLRGILGKTFGQDTMLYCSMVDKTRKGMMGSVGPENLTQVGAPVVLEENEYRNKTTLVPLIVQPDRFVLRLFERHKAFARFGREAHARRSAMGVLFFSDTLYENGHTSEDIARISGDGGDEMVEFIERFRTLRTAANHEDTA